MRAILDNQRRQQHTVYTPLCTVINLPVASTQKNSETGLQRKNVRDRQTSAASGCEELTEWSCVSLAFSFFATDFLHIYKS